MADILLQNTLADNPALQQKLANQELLLQSIQNNYVKPRQVLTIPVVVHILYREPEENISDEQIFSQIDVLNTDFRGFNCEIASIPSEFKDVIADTELEFCLAHIDPDGNPTNGIIRTLTNIPTFDPKGTRHFYTDEGGSNAWDTEHYLNIWVANLGGTLGFASFPDLNPNADEDGVVIDYTAFGTIGTAAEPYHLGRTTTHEIGHYFSLRHPFPGPGVPECVFDDGIEDTPMQQPSYGGRCPDYPQFYCGTSDMFMNFMNYSDDPCLNMFTEGQKARMIAALFTYRAALLTSPTCSKEPGSFNELSLVLLPNPASSSIQIFPPESNIPIGSLRIANIAGQIVFQDNQWPTRLSIDISSWLAGIYFIEFYCNGKTWNAKLVKI
ncbi:MAG: T9SS type A sorting domain-containing protein [Saprospiraceae bacterium]|nr:T9SS type A sorting domain-containing protein [Saprospiraceae bacterium]